MSHKKHEIKASTILAVTYFAMAVGYIAYLLIPT